MTATTIVSGLAELGGFGAGLRSGTRAGLGAGGALLALGEARLADEVPVIRPRVPVADDLLGDDV